MLTDSPAACLAPFLANHRAENADRIRAELRGIAQDIAAHDQFALMYRALGFRDLARLRAKNAKFLRAKARKLWNELQGLTGQH